MTADERKQVCQVILPATWVVRYLPGYVLHALRLWGAEAEFDQLQFLRQDLNGVWGQQFLAAMTRDDVYQSLVKYELPHLLVASDFGVHVEVPGGVTYASKYGVPHFGTFLQVMAECGLPSTYPLRLSDGGSYSLADIVRDDALCLHLSREQEWIACGLARYLQASNWTNRFGQYVSFDAVAARLLQHDPGVRTCNGCHIPHALAVLLAVHRTAPLLSEKTAQQTRLRLREWSRILTKNQNSDGSWPLVWHTDDSDRLPHMTWGSAPLDTISTAGHHLEWMAICPGELRPHPTVIVQAARYLVRAIPAMQPVVRDDWHAYLPLSHAVRSLLLLSGTRPNEIAPLLSEA